MSLPSPTISSSKKKSDGSSTPTKKKWKNLFRRKDSGRPDKDDGDDTSDSVDYVGTESPEQVEHNKNKPHPLLRPRSLVGINSDAIERDEAEDHEPPKPKVKPQFGVHPVDLAAQFPDEPVPAILVACIEILENDVRKEGMFRIPGRMTSIVEMKDSFEQGEGLGVEEPETLEIAGLVAQFFRELPEPLLTYDLYYNWIEAVKNENEEKINEDLKNILDQLARPNFHILQFFIKFLSLVSKNAGANRMGAKNLGLVFGASLLNPPSIDQYDLANIKLQCTVIEYMITSYSYLFEGMEPDVQSTKTRARAVATIPAGNPAAAGGGSNATTVPPQDRRKGFMKRKSTFFVTNHYSGNSARIQNVISLVNGGGKDRDSVSQGAPLSHRDTIQRDTIEPHEERAKKKSKRRKHKDKDSINQESVDVES